MWIVLCSAANAGYTGIGTLTPPGDTPYGLAWDGTRLWCTDATTATIYGMDTSGTVLVSFDAPAGNPYSLAWDGTYLWCAAANGGNVYKLDSAGTVLDSFEAPQRWVRGLTWDGTHLWCTCDGSTALYKLDTSGTVLTTIETSMYAPFGLAWDGSALWVADEGYRRLSRVDTGGTVLDSFMTSYKISCLEFDGVSFWYTSRESPGIHQIQIEGIGSGAATTVASSSTTTSAPAATTTTVPDTPTTALTTTSTAPGGSTATTSIAPGAAGSGDVDGDGRLSAADGALALRGVRTPGPLDAAQRSAADVDGDTVLTEADARRILQWASQGMPLNLTAGIYETVALAVLETQTARVGNGGATITLPSGASLVVPAGSRSDLTVTFSRCDPSAMDAAGDKRCFRITPDLSSVSGARLNIPRDLFSGRITDGAVLMFYNPQTRMPDMRVVAHEQADGFITVPIDARARSDGAATPGADPLTILLAGEPDPAAAARVHPAQAAGGTVLCAAVPYYEQGSYGYCWATSTAMLVNQYRLRAGEKPWDAVSYLTGPCEIIEGQLLTSFYAGTMYADYIRLNTGSSPARALFWNAESMRQYIMESIDAGNPLILFLPHKYHLVVCVGYRVENNGFSLYLNDPAGGIYTRRDWDGIVAGWTIMPCAVAGVPQAAPADTGGVTVNLLGHKEPRSTTAGKGLVFTSPLGKPDADIAFSWYTDATGRHGCLSHNGAGAAVAAVPAYYGMEMTLRVANTDTSAAEVQAAWSLMRLGDEGGAVVAGDTTSALAESRVVTHTVNGRPVFTFTHENFAGLEGDFRLTVEATDPATGTIYDSLGLYVAFDDGIPLQARENEVAGKTVARLTWTGIDNEAVDGYLVFRKVGTGSWQRVQHVPAGETDTVDDTDYDETARDRTRYLVAACSRAATDDPVYYITSDAVPVEEAGEVDFRSCDASDGLQLETVVDEWDEEVIDEWKHFCFTHLYVTNTTDATIQFFRFDWSGYCSEEDYLRPGETRDLVIGTDVTAFAAVYEQGDAGCDWDTSAYIYGYYGGHGSLPPELDAVLVSVEHLNACP